MLTLKALSALLGYPSRELVRAIPAIREGIAVEAALDAASRAALEPLLSGLAHEDLYDLEERYVLLFDRTRAHSLNLFEHVHGESRDRGQAMVDLKALYDAAGFEIVSTELPDYLPLFLEYASTLPREDARALLAEPAHVFEALRERLARKESPYAAVFSALVALAASAPEASSFEALAEIEDTDPDDLEALDRVWEEEEVRFGPGAATAECGVDSLAAKVRQARRPAPGLETPGMLGPRTVFSHSSATDRS
ncbi:nitrate reductase molybdenum cofactor assembly chaperone [Salinarimonas sp. NSM]|uniref:nitrate reductase molybdenum cofactor assembly chaperone n=1 Tax=Salinarimonas sp. NSM TaxID=3458003 RepID=UPI004036A18F